jgi:hypothetical protein
LSDVGATSCELFLRYTGTNAPDYPVFNAFAEGYVAARSAQGGNTTAQDLRTLMSTVTQSCRDHAGEDFVSALASAVNGQSAKR